MALLCDKGPRFPLWQQRGCLRCSRHTNSSINIRDNILVLSALLCPGIPRMFCTIIKYLQCLSKAEFCWLDQSEKVPFPAPSANQSVMGFSSGFLPQHLPEVQVGPTTRWCWWREEHHYIPKTLCRISWTLVIDLPCRGRRLPSLSEDYHVHMIGYKLSFPLQQVSSVLRTNMNFSPPLLVQEDAGGTSGPTQCSSQTPLFLNKSS